MILDTLAAEKWYSLFIQWKRLADLKYYFPTNIEV